MFMGESSIIQIPGAKSSPHGKDHATILPAK